MIYRAMTDRASHLPAQIRADGPFVGPVRRRLLGLAQAQGVPYALMLGRYVHLGFLQRLRGSSHAGELSLKGGALLAALRPQAARFTANLDLQQNHQRLAVHAAALGAALLDVGKLSPLSQADGLHFLVDRIQLQPRKTPYAYAYTEALLPVLFGRHRHVLELHVSAHPAATLPQVPVQLEDLLPEVPYPQSAAPAALRGTGVEQLVAEKLHVLHRAESPGMGPLERLQDLWDLVWVSEQLGLSGGALLAALRQTFEHRQAALPQDLPRLLQVTEAQPADGPVAASWAHFVRTRRPAGGPELLAAAASLRALLEPIYQALRKNHGFSAHWSPPTGWGNKS
jgi:hypothetical protein